MTVIRECNLEKRNSICLIHLTRTIQAARVNRYFSDIVTQRQAGGPNFYCAKKQVTFLRLCSAAYIVLFQTMFT